MSSKVLIGFLIFVNLFSKLLSMSKAPQSTCSDSSFSVRDIKNCCRLPRYTNTHFERICYIQCSGFSHDFDHHKNCVLDCMVHEFHLLSEDGRINKFSVKKMYTNNLDPQNNWTLLIEDAVEKCNINPSASLNEKLKTFFGCIESHLAVNCIDFKGWITECNGIEDHFENCRKGPRNYPDCASIPPQLMHARDCCLTPKLISNETFEKCQDDCETIEFLEPLISVCMENCLMKKTGVKLNNRIDFNIVKKLLIANANKDGDWKERIEIAVNECRYVVQGSKYL